MSILTSYKNLTIWNILCDSKESEILILGIKKCPSKKARQTFNVINNLEIFSNPPVPTWHRVLEGIQKAFRWYCA